MRKTVGDFRTARRMFVIWIRLDSVRRSARIPFHPGGLGGIYIVVGASICVVSIMISIFSARARAASCGRLIFQRAQRWQIIDATNRTERERGERISLALVGCINGFQLMRCFSPSVTLLDGTS